MGRMNVEGTGTKKGVENDLENSSVGCYPTKSLQISKEPELEGEAVTPAAGKSRMRASFSAPVAVLVVVLIVCFSIFTDFTSTGATDEYMQRYYNW